MGREENKEMILKEELENIETEETEMEEEGRLREIEEAIYGLHRRIRAIVEHIDKEEEKATTEKEELTPEEEELWQDGFDTGWDECEKRVTNKADVTKEERTSSEYSKGYADGVKNLAKKMSDDIDKSVENKKELIAKLEEVLSIQMPPFADIATIMSQIQTAIAQQEQANKKETSGEPGEKRGEEGKDKSKSTKHVFGLGRKIGDV